MNNQKIILPEVFTPQERNENTERKRELVKLVVSGEAVLIVGAGSSRRVGYETWDGLMEKLEELAVQCGEGFETDNLKRKEKALEYAEEIKSHIRENINDLAIYYNLLYELFEPKSPNYDEFHRLLVDLPFRGILTTNYDTVLEAALLGKKREAEMNQESIPSIDDKPVVIGQDARLLIHEFLLARYNDPRIPQRILHLHGFYRNPESIILSSKDYIKAYDGTIVNDNSENNQDLSIKEVWTLHRKLLWSILATRRVVFVSFSMDDPYLNKMLEIVGEDLWVRNKSIHFAIMGISPENIKDSKDKADRLKIKYGIETVFYEVFDKSHPMLYELVAEIYKECKVESLPTPTPPDQPVEDVQESRDELNQVKQMSQRQAGRIGDEN